MAKKIRLKVGEDLSPANVLKAINYLEEPKATKKVACEILGISYNTSRLNNIIEEYHETKDRVKRLKAKKRGTIVDDAEAASMIEDYLESGSMHQVSEAHYRSTALVKATILKYGADLLAQKTDYFNPPLLPDISMAESFGLGEIVWSARYNCMAEILRPTPDGEGYWVWILGSCGQQSAQATEDLGSLAHLKNIGVNLERLSSHINTPE